MPQEKFSLEWHEKWGIRLTTFLSPVPPLIYLLEALGFADAMGDIFAFAYAVLVALSWASIQELYSHYRREWLRAQELEQEVRELKKRLKDRDLA